MEDTHGNEIVEDDRKKQEWKTCRHQGHTTAPHHCPLQAEINDNFNPYCTCCPSCIRGCANYL